jgi:uncharacterized protein
LAGDLVRAPIPVTILVVAKAPVPGYAKTRLAAGIGAEAAADVAAAALLDTLDAVVAAGVEHRVVALAGDLTKAKRAAEITARLTDFTVVDQRGDGFGARLANAHADAAAAGLPVLQIGMDTPQVTGPLLAGCAKALLAGDAVLGMAHDGGWWVLGLHDPATARCLHDVPMSQPDTGDVTLRALRDTNLTVTLVPELSDIDTADDLEVVRQECPEYSRVGGGR